MENKETIYLQGHCDVSLMGENCAFSWLHAKSCSMRCWECSQPVLQGLPPGTRHIMPENCIQYGKSKWLRLEKAAERACQNNLEVNGQKRLLLLEIPVSSKTEHLHLFWEVFLWDAPKDSLRCTGHVVIDQMEGRESKWVGVMETSLHGAEGPYGIRGEASLQLK